MGNQSTVVTFERTREVYIYMRDVSYQRKDVVHHFSKKWTDEGFYTDGISAKSKHRTIDNYIRKVKNTYLNFEDDIEIEKGRILARLNDLYKRSVKNDKLKDAREILKEIADIIGLKQAKKIEVSGNVSVLKNDPLE